jgi:hypothetical protein
VVIVAALASLALGVALGVAAAYSVAADSQINQVREQVCQYQQEVAVIAHVVRPHCPP